MNLLSHQTSWRLVTTLSALLAGGCGTASPAPDAALPPEVRGAAPPAAASEPASAPSSGRERSQIPAIYKWNLSELYASDEAWRAARAELAKRLPSLQGFRGHLGESGPALARAIDALFGLDQELQRLGVYASARADEDTRESGPRALVQEADALAVDFASASAYFRPEILKLDPARVHAWQAKEKRLAPYRHYLDDVLRWKPHTLATGEERLVAEAGALTDAGRSVYGLLKDADLPWPTVKLSTGESVRMDPSAYTLHRASKVREDRDRTFQAFFGALAAYRRTFGATLYAEARAADFSRKVRGFPSSLDAALFRDAIPTAVYRRLIADVRANLPTLHRYLALKKRMLGVATLRYQDLYVPMVAAVDLRYAPEEARALTLAAVAPLGVEYTAGLGKGFESGWTDYLPSTGKRDGAYSTGVYGVHPYQLLNFNGRYDDLSTLAHESGHSMHSWLAMRAQPYPTADYSIFVAEVASTLNENLLVHDLLSRTRDDATRLYLLTEQLDRLRTTLFRQTQFAEFELRFHERAERGETLTGDSLSELYLAITREYYGHDEGVCQVDDLIASEWAFIPHFYRGYYVYQYATSIVASTAIARAIREEAAQGQTTRRDAYLRMLRAGGSRYPIDLLAGAGVDMTTSAPFEAAIAEMNAVMDEIEDLLAKQPARS